MSWVWYLRVSMLPLVFISLAVASEPGASVIILAGQSNAAGRANATGLPSPTPTAAPVMMDYVCSFGTDQPGIGTPDRSDGWIPLGPSPAHATGPAHFGPEIGLGTSLASDGPLWIIKHGRGATSLAVDWNPDAVGGPHLYAGLLGQIRAARARLGVPNIIAAFVWVQGEADSTREDWAAAYHRNLLRLIAALRHDLVAPALPIIIVLTGDGSRNPRMTHAAAIRSAQRTVAADVPGVRLVTADDLTLSDSVHYDTASQLELGHRIAAACRVGIAAPSP